MEYHVITPNERALIMETYGGRIVQVLPAPAESLPPGARQAGPAPAPPPPPAPR